MKIIKSEKKLCLSCMEEHMVDTIELEKNSQFNGEAVRYKAYYEYCNETDEVTETEALIKRNLLALKDAYRVKVGLLTSAQICGIRKKYGVTQKDMAMILGWGQATIARYETVQIQDQAHDEILRKIIRDPKWYLEFLHKAQISLDPETYGKYIQKANHILTNMQDEYLKNYIETRYVGLNADLTGNQELHIDKVVGLVNLIAKEVSNVYKVKLMKLLWYIDALNYKRYGKSITGMAYCALPMGAVPVAYEQLLGFSEILYEEEFYQGNIACHFKYNPAVKEQLLSDRERKLVSEVCRKIGNMKTADLVKMMHKEKAYEKTAPNQLISYEYAKDLSLDRI